MEVRQKLIKIAKQKQEWLPNVGTLGTQTLRFVDHLIKNGVTIQKSGRWDDMGDFQQCSVCKGTRLKEVETSYGKAVWVKTAYCPDCGSKMKEDTNE